MKIYNKRNNRIRFYIWVSVMLTHILIINNLSAKIYDVLGREISTLINEVKQAGNFTVDFNGSNLASGIYFYRLESNEFSDIKKMIVVK